MERGPGLCLPWFAFDPIDQLDCGFNYEVLHG
jgi:hypothetical protein